MDAMARLRREVAIPFASNMWVCDPETLQAAVRLMPTDIILADPHRWGGLLACKKLAAVADTLALSLSVHSAAELGQSRRNISATWPTVSLMRGTTGNPSRA